MTEFEYFGTSEFEFFVRQINCVLVDTRLYIEEIYFEHLLFH